MRLRRNEEREEEERDGARPRERGRGPVWPRAPAVASVRLMVVLPVNEAGHRVPSAGSFARSRREPSEEPHGHREVQSPALRQTPAVSGSSPTASLTRRSSTTGRTASRVS